MAVFETGGERPDVAARAASWVGDAVAGIRSKTVEPAEWLVRAVVYGMLAAVVAIALLVLSIDVVVKVLDAYAFPHRVWITELIVAALCLVVATGAWRRMSRARQQLRDHN